MSAFLKTSAFSFGALLAAGAAAQPFEDGPPPPQAGRYQAIRMNDNIVLVIDTATGHCWSRGLSPSTQWRSEGSPVRVVDAGEGVIVRPPGDAPDPFLNLKDGDIAEMTVRQRGRIDVPTSNETLFVHIGDVTEGQTIVSLRDAAGEAIVRERSLRQGESLRFEIDDRPYELRVVELRNLLTGTDFAVLRVQTAREEAERASDKRLETDPNEEAPEENVRGEEPVPVEPRR